MIHFIVILVIVSLFYTNAFYLQMKKSQSSPTSNLSRKMKRKLRSLTIENFSSIYDPIYVDYINSLPTGSGLLENLTSKILKCARQLKVKESNIKFDLGVRPKVILPNLLETATSAGTFTTLLKAMSIAKLDVALVSDDPITIFAPSDESFAKIPEDDLNALLGDIEKLKTILTSHVVSGYTTSKRLVAEYKDKSISTLSGKELAIKATKGDKPIVSVGSTTVVQADIKARNGYIHVIDNVILE